MQHSSEIVVCLEWRSVHVKRVGEEVVIAGDAMIAPNFLSVWDWTVSGTHHSPGVQIQDVKKLIEEGRANEIILATGFEGALRVPDATRAYVASVGASLKIAPSKLAVAIYNERAALGAAVGMLLHTSC